MDRIYEQNFANIPLTIDQADDGTHIGAIHVNEGINFNFDPRQYGGVNTKENLVKFMQAFLAMAGESVVNFSGRDYTVTEVVPSHVRAIKRLIESVVPEMVPAPSQSAGQSSKKSRSGR